MSRQDRKATRVARQDRYDAYTMALDAVNPDYRNYCLGVAAASELRALGAGNTGGLQAPTAEEYIDARYGAQVATNAPDQYHGWGDLAAQPLHDQQM